MEHTKDEAGGCWGNIGEKRGAGREAIGEIAWELEQEQLLEEKIDEAIHVDDYTIPEEAENEPAVRAAEETEEIFAVLERASDRLAEEEEEIFSVLEEDAS